MPSATTPGQPEPTPEFGASVVIPAHNEERVIERCLDSLRDQGRTDLQVVVVANGCTDDTVGVARRYTGLPHLSVLDIAEPSKPDALNAGDLAASSFPRIYLDADICLGPGAVDALIEALDVPQPRAAAPRVTFDLSASSAAVRTFYSVFTQLPYVREGLVGLGVYGMSQAGRERFEQFPRITADDLFAQRIFAPHERVVVDAEFVFTAPGDLRSLVNVRTRVAKGNTELAGQPEPEAADFSASTRGTVRALLGLVRERPSRAPAAAWYAAVTAYSRWRAGRSSTTHWERDSSTR